MKNARKYSNNVSELMEPTRIFFERLIMFMVDLLAFMGL
jgi:hypothetical protein